MSRMTRTKRIKAVIVSVLTVGCAAAGAATQTRWSGGHDGMIPDDAVVLFDGSTWNAWKPRAGAPGDASPWVVLPDGSVESQGGDAVSRRVFADVQLHVEFLCPPIDGARGQHRANSGVYLHGRYEVQILDCAGDAPASDGCGAIYGLAQPLVNASRPAGSWQSFDIIFRAPRFDLSGSQPTEPARMTVIQNGVVVQNNVLLPRPTPGGVDREFGPTGPILLQDKGHQVRFRNIWAREL